MHRRPDRYDYMSLIDRPVIQWPNGARIAFWVVPNIEFYELDPPSGQGRPIWPRPHPDVLQLLIARLRQSDRSLACNRRVEPIQHPRQRVAERRCRRSSS